MLPHTTKDCPRDPRRRNLPLPPAHAGAGLRNRQRPRRLPGNRNPPLHLTTAENPRPIATALSSGAPAKRRRPQMPNSISPLVEHRILAFSIGNPGLEPARIAAEPARSKWGGLQVSAAGIYRVLRRGGLNTRSRLCRPARATASRTLTRSPPGSRSSRPAGTAPGAISNA